MTSKQSIGLLREGTTTGEAFGQAPQKWAQLVKFSDRSARRNVVALLTILFVLGSLIQLPLMLLSGTDDHTTFKLWSYVAATQPITKIYRLKNDGSVPLTLSSVLDVCRGKVEPAVWEHNTWGECIDYPPIIPFILGILGKFYLWILPSYADSRILSFLVSVPGFIADIFLTLLIFVLARKRLAAKNALIVSSIFWLNPMILMAGPLFAYQDPVYSTALIVCLLLFRSNRYALGWMGFAIAVLMKPQGLLIAPTLLFASLARRNLRLLIRSFCLAAAVSSLVLWPYAVDGTLINLLANVRINASEPYVSAQNCNIWWLVTYVTEVCMQLQSNSDIWTQLQLNPQMLYAGVDDYRKLSICLFLVFTAVVLLAWWRKHGRTNEALNGTIIEASALLLYGQSMLITQAHENHAYGPAAVILATWWLSERGKPDKELLAIGVTLSTIVSLNIINFYGLGPDVHLPAPHNIFWFDFSVVLSLANVSVFCWWLWRWLRPAKSVGSIETMRQSEIRTVATGRSLSAMRVALGDLLLRVVLPIRK